MRYLSPNQDIQSIITSLSATGETVFQLNGGTYNLTTDLVIPNNVYLSGETRDGVIIDFGGQPYSVKVYGSNIYNTGTVSVNNGSTTVAGLGTNWTSAMNGQTIFLGQSYFIVSSVGSTTSLTLDLAYFGSNLSNISYSISDPISNNSIKDITIQNSSTIGLDISNLVQSFLENIVVQNCGTGINFTNAQGFSFTDSSLEGNTTDITMTDCWSFTVYDNSFSSPEILLRSGDALYYDNGIYNPTGVGISLTNCSLLTITDTTIDSCTSHGVELVSGNTIIGINNVGFFNGGGDAIKLTTSNSLNLINSDTFIGNSGNGVNIVDATSSKTSISDNIFNANGTAITNNGTETLIRSNIGATDN